MRVERVDGRMRGGVAAWRRSWRATLLDLLTRFAIDTASRGRAPSRSLPRAHVRGTPSWINRDQSIAGV